MGADEAHQNFVGMVSLGTGGSGDERSLVSTFSALELKALRRGRPAPHHTARVGQQGREFIDWYDGLEVVREGRTLSSVVCLPGSDGDCEPFDTGDRYMDVTRAIGGLTWDIHDASYSELLEELGVQASGFRREYFLTQAPPATTFSRLSCRRRILFGASLPAPRRGASPAWPIPRVGPWRSLAGSARPAEPLADRVGKRRGVRRIRGENVRSQHAALAPVVAGPSLR